MCFTVELSRKDLNKLLVPMRLGETPVPISNTTVKTQSADGTALETVWESRWAPDQKKKTTGWKPDEDKTGIGKWVLSETGWSQIWIVKSGANPYQPGRAVDINWFYQWLEVLKERSGGIESLRFLMTDKRSVRYVPWKLHTWNLIKS